MAQYGRPTSDISTGGWVTAPLWSKIDETSASSTDYISADNNGTTCELGLSSLSDPSSSTGHVLRYQHKKVGIATGTTMYLYQGATLIASFTVADTTSWVSSESTLSAAEADAITDYTNLRFKFTSATSFGSVQVSWAEFEVPDLSASTVTITNTPNISGTSINPAAPNAQVVLGNTPNVSGTSITPVGLGVITTVTIPNTPNISGTSINPTAGSAVTLVDDEPLVGTFITNADLVGTFIIDTALSGTFDSTESLDGSI